MSPLLSPLSSHAPHLRHRVACRDLVRREGGQAMNIEHVEAAAMHRDIDRAEQWVAEPYSADDRHPPNPRRNRR